MAVVDTQAGPGRRTPKSWGFDTAQTQGSDCHDDTAGDARAGRRLSRPLSGRWWTTRGLYETADGPRCRRRIGRYGRGLWRPLVAAQYRAIRRGTTGWGGHGPLDFPGRSEGGCAGTGCLRKIDGWRGSRPLQAPCGNGVQSGWASEADRSVEAGRIDPCLAGRSAKGSGAVAVGDCGGCRVWGAAVGFRGSRGQQFEIGRRGLGAGSGTRTRAAGRPSGRVSNRFGMQRNTAEDVCHGWAVCGSHCVCNFKPGVKP